MARKKDFGTVNQPLNSTQRSISWNKGKRTVFTSRIKTNKKTGEVYRSTSSSTVNVFGIIFFILFSAALIRIVGGLSLNTISFQGFLDFLTTVPSIDISSFLEFTRTSLTAPEWLGFLADIWNFLVSFINVIGFLGIGLINAITFIVWFLGWIF